MKIVNFVLITSICLIVAACRSTNTGQTPATAQTPTTEAVATTQPAQPTASPTPTLEVPTLSPEPTATTPMTPTLPDSAPPIRATQEITDTNTVPAVSPTLEATLLADQPPTAAPSGDTPEQGSATCSDLVAYYEDVTIPDGTSFQQGESFVKTWRIRNVGTCNWDSSYSLVFAGGEVMNAPMINPLEEISPGEITDISITLTAPPRGGTYRSNWEFRSPTGEHFGVGSSRNGPLWAEISVIFYISTPETPSGESAPTPEPVAGTCSAMRDQGYEQQILDLINTGRANLGLSPLSFQQQLTAAAVQHSTDMACNNFVDHIGSDGNLWYLRVERQGYANYNSARENIYVGNPEFGGTPAGAYQWWFNSSVHYANIFDPNVSEIGIAYVSNPNSNYVGYYTTVFARP